ncbi:MAG: hypothetical protein ACP5I7_05745 [Sulfolobales archaeon]
MRSIYITKPYKILGSINLIFPSEIIDKTLGLVSTRSRGLVVFIKDLRTSSNVKILDKPLFSITGSWGKWIFFKEGRIYSCSTDLSKCEILYEVKRGDNLYIIDSLTKYVVLGNKSKDVIIRSLDEKLSYYTKSPREIIKILYKDLELLLLNERRRKKLLINEKIFEIDDYCYSRDLIWQTLAFKAGSKIYAIHGILHGEYRYIEASGRNIKCLTRGDVGSIIVDNKMTFIIGDREIYEISGEVEGLGLLQDSVLVYNPSTKWLSRYFEKEVKYITRVDPTENIRFIGQIEDSLIIKIGSSVRDYRGMYSKVISSVSEDEIVSVYHGYLVVDKGNYLGIIDRFKNSTHRILKKEFIKCMAHEEALYCLDTMNNVLYKIDLLENETIEIGYLKGRIAKIHIGNYKDILDIEVWPSIKSLQKDTLYIYIPFDSTETGKNAEIHSMFILGEYRDHLKSDSLEPILRIKEAYLKISSKGLSKYCGVKSPLYIYLEPIDNELVDKFNYLLILRNSNPGKKYIEHVISGSDMIHEDNRGIILCVDKDMSYTDKLYLDLYIVDKDDTKHRYLIDTSDIHFIQRDIEVEINQIEDKLSIEIRDEVNEAFINEVNIRCRENEYKFKVDAPVNRYVISKKDLKDLCGRSVRIDLWIEDKEFTWGFSNKINILDGKKTPDMISEDKINTILIKSRLLSNNRLVDDYEVIVLPREKLLRIKVFSDSYIIYDINGEIFLNKLSKGTNIIPLKDVSEEDYILLKIFDGLYQENLIIKINNYVRDLIYAYKHANILKEILRLGGS